MRLISSDGTNFSLTIAGYQFPHLEAEPYDSNWLNIQIEVAGVQGRWRATDPALLTYEVAELAGWLEVVASGDASSGCSFIEPCLWFEIADQRSNPVAVNIVLDHEFRPPWPAQPGDEEGIAIRMIVTPEQLRSAAAELRAQLERYPQRAER